MRKLIGNKKGFDAFTFILTIMAVSVLILILVGLTIKYNNLANTFGGAGSSASKILSAYDRVDGALLYLDNAVGLSIQAAVYDLACNGFYQGKSGCEPSGDYVLWSSGRAVPSSGGSCVAVIDKSIPADYSAFNSYFMDKLDSHIAMYNAYSDVKLLEDNYELSLGRPGELFCSGEACEGRNAGQLQLVGVAKAPLVVSDSRLRYEVMPSFRENGDVNLIGDFEKLTSGADALIGRVTKDGQIDSYQGSGLEWNVEKYDKASRNCDTGKSCEICEEKCETGSDGEESCCQVCYSGELLHDYYDVTANVGVRIIDKNYEKGGSGGYKAFVTDESGSPTVKEYKYRFGLNWVEMGDVECVANRRGTTAC